MVNRKRLALTALVVAMFLVAIPSTAPRVYAAATPCSPKCTIAILSPGSGGALNKNQTVNPTFLVSFLVKNFTFAQPGTTSDINTTTTGPNGKPNEGHIHVFVDNAYVTIWTSTNGIPLTLSIGTHTVRGMPFVLVRSEEHTSELQSHLNLVCRLLLEKKNRPYHNHARQH